MQTSLLLEMIAGAAPERLAFGRLGDGLTYTEAEARARAAAAWLRDRPAEHVVYLGLNGPTLPIALFASGLAGRVFAPLNYRLPDADLAKLVARTAPCVVIVDDDMLHRLPAVPGVTILPRSTFESEYSNPTHAGSDLAQVDSDIGVLLFTSGTTGDPKAVILRHHNLTAYVTSTVEFLSSEENEASLVSVPPYHIAGIAAILSGVYCGRRIVHLPHFTPEAWVNQAHAEKITHAMVVPTMLSRILDVLEKSADRLPNFHSISYGGGRMPKPVIERAMRMLPHVNFVNGYGLTETSSTIAVLTPEDHRIAMASSDPKMHRRIASVGKPLPSVEVEIRSPDGTTLGPNEVGEIYVRGEQVSGEYTHKKMLCADGWFATNDSGCRDDEGYLFVEGRLDDVIVRGGENISPGEIEDLIRLHPSVADVAVLGLPDDEWGERVAAAVVSKDGQCDADALADWVKSRLRSTKTPEIWKFTDALPYSETGKVLRRQLKAEIDAVRHDTA